MSEWIDRDIEFPDLEFILCCEGKKIYICELLESKWGNSYVSTGRKNGEDRSPTDWTHWMPLPQPPEKK